MDKSNFNPNKPENYDQDINTDSCLLTKLESDLHFLFEELAVHEPLRIQKFLRSIDIAKEDYILSLQTMSSSSLPLCKEKISNKIKDIPYIDSFYFNNEHKNLIFNLDKAYTYNFVIDKVMMKKENYGLIKDRQSFFIIAHNHAIKDMNALRVAVVVDHLVSFLSRNYAKVSVNDHKRYSNLSLKNISTICNEECNKSINNLSHLIVNTALESKWRKNVESSNDCIYINTKEYVSPIQNFNSIKISSNMSEIVLKSADAIHFNTCHGINNDIVLHVCFQGEKYKVTQSSLLLEILNLSKASPRFLCLQDVFFKNQNIISPEKLIEEEKNAIIQGMIERYGSDVDKNEVIMKNVNILVDTVLKFTFLATGIQSPLKIDYSDNQNFKKKSGIFVQYNFARLSQLLAEFESKVENGDFPTLPQLHEINFNLLRREEEWKMLKFVLNFPRLVNNIYSSITSFKETFNGNEICIMLTKLCNIFSKYYSRVRILTSPQPSLLKVMYARLWLLKSVHQIMSNALSLINIEGLTHM